MLVTNELQRVFLFSNEGSEVELPDPNATMSPEQVLNFYSGTYPILTTAKWEGPEINNDRIEYRLTTTIGTKG